MNNKKLIKQGIYLEYATLIWNIIGVLLLVFIVPSTHSVSLIAFGFDTLLEIGASIIVIWELSGIAESRQKVALRYLSIAFFLLGLYLLIQSIYNLYSHVLTVQSNLGISWLGLTFLVMLILAYKKYQVGKKINNKVLLTEGRVTSVDAALALIVLMGFLLTTYLGWWWTDSLVGIILTFYCFGESKHAWKESTSG